MYLNYEEYAELGGTLEEADFQDLEFDAESTINWYTFNRLKRPEWKSVLDSDELKRCVYQLIRLGEIERSIVAGTVGGVGFGTAWQKEPGITEQSNDGVVTKYATASSGELLAYFNPSKKSDEVVQRYLNITNDLGYNILFRGIYPGE